MQRRQREVGLVRVGQHVLAGEPHLQALVAVSDVSAGADPMRMPWMHALRRRFDVEVVPIDASSDVLFFSDFGTGHIRHQGLKVWLSCENMLPD
ncbi:MAG: hypothetical protein ACKOTD_01250, partial [Phycisphaerales bacterium]